MNKFKIATLLCWIVLLLLSLEVIIPYKNASSSDLVYIESIYQDIFVRNYSINGWLVSKAPYFFPDWMLYFIIRLFINNYTSAWYIYTFLNLIIIILIFNYSLKLIYNQMSIDTTIFSFIWGALLLTFVFSTPNGLDSHTFLYPVYHSGALLNGLLIMLCWLSCNKNNNTAISLFNFIITMLATMSDLWFVLWFVIPIFVSTIFLVYTKKIDLKCNLSFNLVMIAGVLLGELLNRLIENTGLLYYSQIPIGTPAYTFINQLNHFFRDLFDLFINSPVLFTLFIINIIVSIYSIIICINGKLFEKTTYKLNKYMNSNINLNLLILLNVLSIISFIIPLIPIIYLKMWEQWNYRYIHHFIVLPWLLIGIYLYGLIWRNSK